MEEEVIESSSKLTQKEYRGWSEDSYSSFKDFLEDRKRYHRKYILGEKIAEKEDLAIRMGGLVDTLILCPDEFEQKFYLTEAPKIPTGQMKDFTENLYTISQANPSYSLEERLKEAYNATKYDETGKIVAFKQDKASSFENIVVKFEKECAQYFQEIMACRPQGLIVISTVDLQNAEKIKDELLTNPFTSKIMRQKTEDEWEVENQVSMRFEILDLPTKGLIDKRLINHKEKWIKPIDLKVTWNVEEFTEKYYLYRRSDLQAAVYYIGTLAFRDEHYPDYRVCPMEFIVADSINYMSPLIYTTTEEDFHDSMKGFTYKNRYYKGLTEIISDLKWAKENDIWHVSRENFINNGVCRIKK